MVKNSISSRYALSTNMLKYNETAIVDSGCTSHFLGVIAHCTHIKKCASEVTFKLPNNMPMKDTRTALLDMPHTLLEARHCHLFPNMRNKSLLSIAKCYDNGYRAIFTTRTLIMEHETDPSNF